MVKKVTTAPVRLGDRLIGSGVCAPGLEPPPGANMELLGHTVEELRALVQEGIDSGPSFRASMADVKIEARRRFEASSADD